MPTATRYNLSGLAQQLNILLSATHRALDDAKVTQYVYLAMLEKARALPLDLLAEIVRMGSSLDWLANWPLQQVLRQRAKEPIQAKKAPGGTHGPLFAKPTQIEDQNMGGGSDHTHA